MIHIKQIHNIKHSATRTSGYGVVKCSNTKNKRLFHNASHLSQMHIMCCARRKQHKEILYIFSACIDLNGCRASESSGNKDSRYGQGCRTVNIYIYIYMKRETDREREGRREGKKEVRAGLQHRSEHVKMCVCVYVCMYVCMHTHIFICLSVYLSICLSIL
jgi:hypothetical protein